MGKVTMGIGLVIGIFFCMRAADLHARIDRSSVEIARLNQEIARMKTAIGHMANLAESEVLPLETTMRRFYEAMDVLSHYRDIKSIVHIEGGNEREATALTFKPSQWPGIVKAEVKVDCVDIAGMDQYMAILDFMHEIENQIPLRITRIDGHGKNLSFNVEAYGKGGV